MRIFFYETRKLFCNVRILIFLLATAIINIIFLLYNEYNGDFSPSQYKAVWQDLSTMTQSEKSTFLQEKSQAFIDGYFDIDKAQELSFDYTGNWVGEESLINYVRDEVNSSLTYGDYLTSVEENAEILASMPIFADKNSFDYRNIMKTRDDFRKLERKAFDPQPSKGILTAVRFGFTDLLALILMLLFSVVLISREKELDQVNLFRTSEKGGVVLALSKLSAIFFADIFAVILLYGGSMLTGLTIYGFGDLNLDVQSVYGYFGSSLNITVGQFLICFLLLKLLVCLAFSALSFFLSSLVSGSVFNIAATLVITAIEGALYFFIQPSSIFAPLRQINIFASADSGNLLGKYLNINLFGTPIFSLPMSIAVAVFAVVFFSFSGVMSFCGRRQKAKLRVSLSLPFGKHTSLICHEMQKTFIGGKALLLLAALAFFTAYTYKPVKISYGDISDYIYFKYTNSLQGEITEEKLRFIESELDNAYDDNSEGSRYKIEALERLKAHSLYLLEKDGLLFNDKGYDLLTGGNKQNDRFTACFMAVFMTIIAGSIYSEEYKTGLFRLLKAAPLGKGKTLLCKLVSASLAGFFLLLIINGTEIYNILTAYGTDFIFAPVHSMEKLEAAGEIPIFWYLMLLELGRFMALVLQSLLIFLLSLKAKSYSFTVIGGVTVFAIPPIIAAMGFVFMDYFLLNPLLIGNVFVQ
ncbi:MAG: hypothetical protein NC452_16460 [Eubacterium sp.]|nr:hypothetical protein [Eubacterium sp.]